MRRMLRLFGPGLLVTILPFLAAAVLVGWVGVDWSWHLIALVGLAAGALLITMLYIQPGQQPSAPTGYMIGYSPQDAMVELMGRETAGTVTESSPSLAHAEVFTNILPPVIAFVVLLVAYRIA